MRKLILTVSISTLLATGLVGCGTPDDAGTGAGGGTGFGFGDTGTRTHDQMGRQGHDGITGQRGGRPANEITGQRDEKKADGITGQQRNGEGQVRGLEGAQEGRFHDVDPFDPDLGDEDQDWFAEAVEWNAQHGIFEGDPQGNFNPDDYLKRSEAAQLMKNLADEGYINVPELDDGENGVNGEDPADPPAEDGTEVSTVEELNDALADDTIDTIILADGSEFEMTEPLTIDRSVTLRAETEGEATFDRTIVIRADDVTIDGVRVDSDDDQGIVGEWDTPIDNVVIQNNTLDHGNIGAQVSEDGSITIEGNTIEDTGADDSIWVVGEANSTVDVMDNTDNAGNGISLREDIATINGTTVDGADLEALEDEISDDNDGADVDLSGVTGLD